MENRSRSNRKPIQKPAWLQSRLRSLPGSHLGSLLAHPPLISEKKYDIVACSSLKYSTKHLFESMGVFQNTPIAKQRPHHKNYHKINTQLYWLWNPKWPRNGAQINPTCNPEAITFPYQTYLGTWVASRAYSKLDFGIHICPRARVACPAAPTPINKVCLTPNDKNQSASFMRGRRCFSRQAS